MYVVAPVSAKHTDVCGGKIFAVLRILDRTRTIAIYGSRLAIERRSRQVRAYYEYITYEYVFFRTYLHMTM